MRSWLELGRARLDGADLEPEESERLGWLELLLLWRPDWRPAVFPTVLRLRTSPAGVLVASWAAETLSPGESASWGILGAPWGCLAGSEVWAASMRDGIEGGLLAGPLPRSMAERAASVVRLGPRLVGVVESGERAERVRL